jgi:hypothetical protein
MLLSANGFADDGAEPTKASPGITPDISDAPLPASVRKGNIVAVPIPFSNPTLENGLVGVAAYFYPQTETQKASQPPSVSGIGAMYTSNESWGVALGHSAYWDEDRWRLAGVVGHADVQLPLLVAGIASGQLEIDWLLRGTLVYTSLSRRVGSNWYVGLIAQYLDIEQDFSIDFVTPDFVIGNTTRSVALGPIISYDTRDVPANAYTGRYFKATAVVNSEAIGSDLDYESYSLAYRSYHQVSPSVVVGLEAVGCMKSDDVPLWDACRIGLRGFASTDYMGKSSLRAQAELRWKWSRRWGAAVFGGAGQITESLVGLKNNDIIPSYGAGFRFTVQPEQRIVMRLDYGRSSGSDAWYLAVGQAF